MSLFISLDSTSFMIKSMWVRKNIKKGLKGSGKAVPFVPMSEPPRALHAFVFITESISHRFWWRSNPCDTRNTSLHVMCMTWSRTPDEHASSYSWQSERFWAIRKILPSLILLFPHFPSCLFSVILTLVPQVSGWPYFSDWGVEIPTRKFQMEGKIQWPMPIQFG